jgi:hypothetical protein
VPDADVTAHSLATNQEFTGKTNSLGYLELRSIPPGGYRVTVSSKSFRNLVISRADVVVAQNTDLGVLKMEMALWARQCRLKASSRYHTASIYFIYDLPFFKAQKGFPRACVGWLPDIRWESRCQGGYR